MKKCFKCGVEKQLDEFYKHPQMKDGRVNKCKECNKKDVRDNRSKNLDYYRDYDNRRFKENGSRSRPSKAYRKDNPKKYWAHTALSNAVRDGKIVRPQSCDQCGENHRSIHGHHDDYDKPLDVRWLCPPCHFAWHKKHGEGLNSE